MGDKSGDLERHFLPNHVPAQQEDEDVDKLFKSGRQERKWNRREASEKNFEKQIRMPEKEN